MTTKAQKMPSDLLKAHNLLSTKPSEALKIAESLLDHVDESPELLGQVLTTVGLARQICGDRDAARSAFQSAAGVETSRLERGLILCRWGILELECHRLTEGLHKTCQGVALIESEKPQDCVLAQGWIARAIAFRRNSQYDSAEFDVKRALGVIHPGKDQRLHYAAVQNLSLVLLFGKRDPKRIRRGLETLDEANRLLRRYRIPLKSVQNASLIWAKGLAYRLLGADERGRGLLQRSERIFFEIEALTDWIRVCLDLIEIYLHFEKWGLVRKTLTRIVEHAKDTEIVAVLAAFRDAIQTDAVLVTQEMVNEVYLKVHGEMRRPPVVGRPEAPDHEKSGW